MNSSAIKTKLGMNPNTISRGVPILTVSKLIGRSPLALTERFSRAPGEMLSGAAEDLD